MIKLSVFYIYVVAWLLAFTAMALSAVILTSTFGAVQSSTVATQRDTGMGQVITINSSIAGTLQRMTIATNSMRLQFLTVTDGLPDSSFDPESVLGNTTPLLAPTWLPASEEGSEMSGFLINYLYPRNAKTFTYARCLQAYAIMQGQGSKELFLGFSNSSTELIDTYEVTYNGSVPVVGALAYSIVWFPFLQAAFLNDNFFFQAIPWSASNGHAYWYYIQQGSFKQGGVDGTMMVLANGAVWLDTILAIRAPGAEILLFDSRNMSLAASPQEEQDRLSRCAEGGAVNSSNNCILFNAADYPVDSVKIPFNALFHPAWNQLYATPVNLTFSYFMMGGVQYAAVSGTIVSVNLLRINIIWYQPALLIGSDGGTITGVICVLTVMSTLVLTLLGVFGVLLPLMRLGKGLRMVADNLKAGTNGAIVARNESLFTEVNTIGRDFETIVVDYLGFSSGKARDSSCAPKDPTKPFVVVFTDIEGSSLLWGRDATEMARCLKHHHEIIRELLRIHRLYEVKTVGDSFMATTSSALDAVNFAVALEESLFSFQWEWPEAEDVYQQTHLMFRKTSWDGGSYDDLWNGLRVRVGIHHGVGDILFDEVAGGYDYYGPVVNAAARIEHLGHGGQILASETVLRAINLPINPLRMSVRRIGVQPLRGIESPPPLFEIIPRSLAQRTYPPLRVKDLDDDLAVEDIDYRVQIPEVRDSETPSGDGSTNLGSHVGSGHDATALTVEDVAARHSLVRNGVMPAALLVQHLVFVRDLLEDALLPLGKQFQLATLTSICKGWGVAVRPGRSEVATAMLVVAQRVSEGARSLAYLRARARPERYPNA